MKLRQQLLNFLRQKKEFIQTTVLWANFGADEEEFRKAIGSLRDSGKIEGRINEDNTYSWRAKAK